MLTGRWIAANTTTLEAGAVVAVTLLEAEKCYVPKSRTGLRYPLRIESKFRPRIVSSRDQLGSESLCFSTTDAALPMQLCYANPPTSSTMPARQSSIRRFGIASSQLGGSANGLLERA
jgi:hypothetical protein